MKTITGQTRSRLVELRNFNVSGNGLSDLYMTSSDITSNGLNLSLSTSGITASTFVYYIDSITYIDNVVTGQTTTTYSVVSSGTSDSNNFNDYPIIKDFSKIDVNENPEVNSDVFIERQSISVFESLFRLKNISNLNELEKYAGGTYFNIVKNN